MSNQFICLLHQMATTTPTEYWNDSCSVQELNYAIERGAVGATTNPQILLGVLKKEMNLWEDHINKVIHDNPTWSEIEVSWKVFEDVAVEGANLLMPVFEHNKGKRGRLSIQTNPAFYRNSDAILEQATYFHSLAPNIQVKVPATSAGLDMVEEATYRGINLNATVSFSVPQVLAVGEAVERGLKRRESEGVDVSKMSPVTTMMVGRIDDWLKIVAKKEANTINPDYLDWAGIACMKKAYGIYKERGYRARLLVAAYRNFYHITEFIGGDMTQTIPYEWQKKFNESGMVISDRINIPVKSEILKALNEIEDFRKVYNVDGMTPTEFDTFGATVRTLRGFIQSWHDLVAIIRDFMLPNPDL